MLPSKQPSDPVGAQGDPDFRPLTNARGTGRLGGQGTSLGFVMKYTVILEREPDGGFVVSVPVLPGCVSQGDTKEEALANIREAAELYLEDCRAAGDPIPQEDSLEYVELRTGTL